jgi:Zn-dependent M16 (insulinase) family peptidase
VHETKGMEVFHLLNDDEENLFAFSFKTPPKDSTGAAHVLEHSVLCGSEHFPLKDPFIRLANQSIKTYLNAWTASDHTVYPASSQVKADYFNLMAVYADAVFFPLLKKEIFMQEAHRLEWDAKEDSRSRNSICPPLRWFLAILLWPPTHKAL